MTYLLRLHLNKVACMSMPVDTVYEHRHSPEMPPSFSWQTSRMCYHKLCQAAHHPNFETNTAGTFSPSTDISSPSRLLISLHHALGIFSLFCILFWNLKHGRKQSSFCYRPRAYLERCAVCIHGEMRIRYKGNVLLKHRFKLMFSKIASFLHPPV